ncbi:TPA: amidinotransferase [Candidatus Saccharibacteria bacterium]|nr:amidinotransferase [Candidatus Saccharibacteria bacterium]HRF28068.1 arginine deiminase-related protein [Candidatus Saccharibacteria bacterium]HRJ91234.1 arginine deiminase-related protein [Candidatus Saccharibacteria bacterium]
MSRIIRNYVVINSTVLMSGVDYFSDEAPINPFMTQHAPINLEKAKQEHDNIQQALESIGINVKRVDPPASCQDGVFTANWALVRGDKAVLARLPNARKAEEAYAKQALEALGKTVYELPPEIEKFSGQGDALPCGNYLFCGTGYRSEEAAQEFAAKTLGFELIRLHAKPVLDDAGKPAINSYSGWPDSLYYDIDLAISVLKAPVFQDGTIVENGLVGYCADALLPESVETIRSLQGIDLIEVSEDEAINNLACNLVSTGTHVVMNDAPNFAAAIEAHGLSTIRLHNTELAKGGGSMRCTTLTLE